MARPKGTPRYLHHKASGKAFVRIDGKNIYLGFFGTKESKAEYDRVISEWLANGRQLPQTNNLRKILTIDAICCSFLEYATGYYRKNGEITSEFESSESIVLEKFSKESSSCTVVHWNSFFPSRNTL